MTLAMRDRERLRKILDLSDRLGALRRRAGEGASAPVASEIGAEVRAIAGKLVTIGLPGALGRLAEAHRFSPQETLVLLLLLNRRIEGEDAALTGREILSLLFPSSFGILSATRYLEVGAPLRRSGALLAVEPVSEDLLEVRYCIGDDLYREVEREASDRGREIAPPPPYTSHFEHLADLGRLTALLLRRGNALLDLDPFGFRVFEERESTAALERRIRALAEVIRDRLAATPGAERFPLVKLARSRKLALDEQLILTALLIQDCYFGNPVMDAVDCVKMVSRTPEEILRKRSLLDASGTLVREGLVEIHDSVDERDAGLEVVLPDWVSTLMLDEEGRAERRPIGPDTRLEFHEYLQSLGDSDQFFRDLDPGAE